MDDFAPDRLSLSPKLDLSRRRMLVTTLATGFAAAVQPVAAQSVITTDTSGLEASEIKIKMLGSAAPWPNLNSTNERW